MGKKSKNGPKNGQPKSVEKAADQNGKSETNLVGLAKHSKNIKKQESKAAANKGPKELKAVAKQQEQTVVQQPKKDKKNKKKNKGPQTESSAVRAEVAAASNGKQKKNKKNKGKPAEENESEEVETPKPKNEKKVKDQKPKAIEADQEVETSESESEDEPMEDDSADMDKVNENILSEHSKPDEGDESSEDEEEDADKSEEKPAADGEKKERKHKGPEHSIFIGNLPSTVKRSTVRNLFKQYGKILTLRFRTHDGVVMFHKKDRKDAKALNCYVRFETKQEAEAACAMNGQLIEGNRVRVSLHTQKQQGHAASTVFVGNIHRNTTDNELYDFFARVGEIEYVRQIAAKGFGYVCFKKGVSIAKALKLNEQLLNGRPLRIQKLDPNRQSTKKNKKGNLVKKNRLPTAGADGNGDKQQGAKKNGGAGGDEHQKKRDGKPAPKDFHGTIAKGKFGKKHKSKGKPDMKKKVLAQKLMAAGAGKKK